MKVEEVDVEEKTDCVLCLLLVDILVGVIGLVNVDEVEVCILCVFRGLVLLLTEDVVEVEEVDVRFVGVDGIYVNPGVGIPGMYVDEKGVIDLDIGIGELFPGLCLIT